MSKFTANVDNSGGESKNRLRRKRAERGSKVGAGTQVFSKDSGADLGREHAAIRVDRVDAGSESSLPSREDYWAAPRWRVRVNDGRRMKWIHLARPFALIGAHRCCALRIRGLKVPEVAYIACCLRDRIEVWPTAPIAFPRWGAIDSKTEVIVGPCSLTFHLALHDGRSGDVCHLDDPDSSIERNQSVGDKRLIVGASHLADAEVETCFFGSGNDLRRTDLKRTLRRPVTIIGDDHPSILRVHQCGMLVCNHAAVIQDETLWLVDLSPKMMKRHERVRRFNQPGDRLTLGDAEMELISVRSVVQKDRFEASAARVAKRVRDDCPANIERQGKLKLNDAYAPAGDLSAETAWNRVHEALGLRENAVEDPEPTPTDTEEHREPAASTNGLDDANDQKDSVVKESENSAGESNRHEPSQSRLTGVDKSDGNDRNECNEIEGEGRGAEAFGNGQESSKIDESEKPRNEDSQLISSTDYDPIDVPQSTTDPEKPSPGPILQRVRLGSLLVAFRGAFSVMNKIVSVPITVFRRSDDGAHSRVDRVVESQVDTSDDVSMSAIDLVMQTANRSADLSRTLELDRVVSHNANDSGVASSQLPEQRFANDANGMAGDDADTIVSGLTMRLSKLNQSRGARSRTLRRFAITVSLILLFAVVGSIYYLVLMN